MRKYLVIMLGGLMLGSLWSGQAVHASETTTETVVTVNDEVNEDTTIDTEQTTEDQIAEDDFEDDEAAEVESDRKATKTEETETVTATLTQKVSTATKNAAKRLKIVTYAQKFVGNPYRYGGTSLTKGADCSGFVMSVYKNFGYSIPRSSRQQAKAGKTVSVSKMQAGDLIFYKHGTSTVKHVAMYIGNGKVVHASTYKTGIKISKYNYSKPYKAVSFVK